jgi:hypothetical protein
MRRFIGFAVFLSLGIPSFHAESQALPRPTLNCNVGPLSKTFGKSHWLLYSCNDASTLIVVSAPGSPATPFIFSFSLEGGSYHLRGEGTGAQGATDAAYNELHALSASAIRELIEQTKHAGK